MQDCDAEGKACCGSTPPCSSSNATCLGRSYAAQAKATNTSTLVYMAAAKKQNAPFPPGGRRCRTAKLGLPNELNGTCTCSDYTCSSSS